MALRSVVSAWAFSSDGYKSRICLLLGLPMMYQRFSTEGFPSFFTSNACLVARATVGRVTAPFRGT
jgi:hypothetical protein